VIAGQRVALGASAPDVTIEIVNSAVTSIFLTTLTGEVFPLTVPAGVTITAANPEGLPPVFVAGFDFKGPRWRLSHVSIECASGVGVMAEAGSGTIDHVTVKGCALGVEAAGPVTLGPGLVAEQNIRGVQIGSGTTTITGGHGTEHTSISQNQQFGVFVQGINRPGVVPPTLQILAPAIVPDTPDANDVAIDDNHEGLFIDEGPATAVLHGVHLTGNALGIEVYIPSTTYVVTLELRGSFLAGNQLAAFSLSGGNIGAIDLGGSAPADQGRNVFSTAAPGLGVNTGGELCVSFPSGSKLRAAGNIFRGVDCMTGGVLNHELGCSGQADIGGSSAVDVGLCTITN
jgi:hypothetical protein